jgi:glucokinase
VRAGDDALARKTLEVFCGFLGSVVADMALTCSLRAGNRSQNRDFLLNSDFAARYFNTVPKRAALARIPVRLFERGQPGVAGAAHRYPD